MISKYYKQTLAQTKSRSLSSNPKFFLEVNMATNKRPQSLIQKGEGTNMGAG
jgi:hypothetical protein